MQCNLPKWYSVLWNRLEPIFPDKCDIAGIRCLKPPGEEGWDRIAANCAGYSQLQFHHISSGNAELRQNSLPRAGMDDLPDRIRNLGGEGAIICQWAGQVEGFPEKSWVSNRPRCQQIWNRGSSVSCWAPQPLLTSSIHGACADRMNPEGIRRY